MKHQDIELTGSLHTSGSNNITGSLNISGSANIAASQSVNNNASSGSLSFWQGSLTEYNAISASADNNTVYFVTE